ncbi:MAG: radical SAM protein [Tyzzerella sp.]|nr:radical SAM protein [Tyzzerella sp.]
MIKKLYIEPSSLCNLNCSMCFRNNWFEEKKGLMSKDTKNILFQIFQKSNIETVFFGGMGEPLMHPDIIEMVSCAVQAGKRTELITNATLLNSTMVKNLLRAGLHCLWVSMDGFSRESYEGIRKGSMYSLIMKNLEEFNRQRTTTQLGITFVMMKENEYELQHINRFADDIHADFINLSHVLPGEPLNQEEALYEKDYPVGKMTRFLNHTSNKVENLCPFIAENCCFIRWDGEVCPCMQLLHNSYTYLYNEKRKVYSKSYGNINTQDFSDIFNSSEYMDFQNNVSEFNYPCCTICMGCEDRLENKKDCMYNIEPTCGACLWAQGLIRCP